jgi:hypothetical protein
VGAALLSAVVSGDSLFYVRAGMTVPLLIAGLALIGLGLAAMTQTVVPHHVPKSAIIVVVPIVFLLMIRPGPLSVDTGLAYDGFGRAPIQTSIVIPTSAVVGVDASATAIADNAIDVDPAQFRYAADQLAE